MLDEFIMKLSVLIIFAIYLNQMEQLFHEIMFKYTRTTDKHVFHYNIETMESHKWTDNKSDYAPMCFKVIGIGSDVTDIIRAAKKYGYNGVDFLIAESPTDCIPTDNDKMAIIVASENYTTANDIARNYHDAGILTIGLVCNADSKCYNCIAKDVSNKDVPNIIKSLLLPIVTDGYFTFDFLNLWTIFQDDCFFKILYVERADVRQAVAGIKEAMKKYEMSVVKHISVHLFFNRKKENSTNLKEISEMFTIQQVLPESVKIITSINIDDTLPEDRVRLTTIISGKHL